jgi:hypothetical protein
MNMLTTAPASTATGTTPESETRPLTTEALAAAEAVALLDRRLAEWGQSGRSLVRASDVVDLALDLRLLLTP